MTPRAAERHNGRPTARGRAASWQAQSVERSLQDARRKALARCDQFINAAVEIIEQDEVSDFTLQDVVDRCGMSLRTFYSYFDSKDSLVLAVYETILLKMTVPVLREACERESDPRRRLQALIDSMAELSAIPNPVTRALCIFYLRLTESRSRDLAHALGPIRNLIVELLTEADQAGYLRDELDVPTQAGLILELLLSSAHAAVLGGPQETTSGQLWAFCSAAILQPRS
jgi:AcrR family transcriptional regulator